MKIKKILIENYRFFKDKQPFNFDAQNILLYGENGSGKTSLYNALLDFFFYYKDEVDSKKSLKENKNIFANTTNEPQIEITFDNDTTIKFTKDGLDTDSLKSKIEQVSKSKLFLTYQDIYNLNKIFKKDISYKEFKEIFITLYFDELSASFEIFDKNFEELKDIVLNYTHDMKTDYENIEKIINDFDEQFTYELEPILKKDPVDKDEYISSIYDTVFYVSEEYIDKLKESKKMLDTFFEICSNDKVFHADYYDLQSRFIDIIKNVMSYTRKSDRYEEDELSEKIMIIDKEDVESISKLDNLIHDIEVSAYDTVYRYFECEKQSKHINETIFSKLNASKDKINEILSFLDIDIKIEEIKDKPFLYFDTDYIFTEYIRNIDFKILLSRKELKKHWSNLNEAKLSALNFAIYLSSVLDKKPDIPILVLDDLLISLDMSNRDRILKLLLDRSGTYFDEDYQILIFTHDRAFYELAKHKIEYQDKDNWNFFELFVDSENTIEKPYLKSHIGIHQKAQDYFDDRDYAIASNYLRKEVEKLINEFLGLKTLDGAINTAKMKDNYLKLQECFPPLITALTSFSYCSDIPEHLRANKCVIFSQKVLDAVLEVQGIIQENSFHDLDGIRNRILNPQSHNDITMPLYKNELEDAFKIVKELEELILNQD